MKVSKEGKHISEKFAPNYFDEIAIGIDFTARDIQQRHKEKGLPWELAKAFDNSAAVSNFVGKDKFADLKNINFKLDVNGNERQIGNTSLMLFSFDYIISFVSQYITLKKGDLIFTGTPQGVAKVNIGDRLEGYLENEKLLDFLIK